MSVLAAQINKMVWLEGDGLRRAAVAEKVFDLNFTRDHTMHHKLMRVAYHILYATSCTIFAGLHHEDANFAMAVEDKRNADALSFAQQFDINSRMSSLRRTPSLEKLYTLVGTNDYPVPISWAVFVKNREIIDALLADPRLNINAANNEGASALHTAIAINDPALVKLLLENGANPAAKIVTKQIDFSGMGQHITLERTALDLAQKVGNAQIIALLKNPPPLAPVEKQIPTKPMVPEETIKHLRELSESFSQLYGALQ